MPISLYFMQLKFLWDELSSILSATPFIYDNAKNIVVQQRSCHGVSLGTPRSFFNYSQSSSLDGVVSFNSTNMQFGTSRWKTIGDYQQLLLLIRQRFKHLNHQFSLLEKVNVLFLNIVTSMVIILVHATRSMASVKKSSRWRSTSATFTSQLNLNNITSFLHF